MSWFLLGQFQPLMGWSIGQFCMKRSRPTVKKWSICLPARSFKELSRRLLSITSNFCTLGNFYFILLSLISALSFCQCPNFFCECLILSAFLTPVGVVCCSGAWCPPSPGDFTLAALSVCVSSSPSRAKQHKDVVKLLEAKRAWIFLTCQLTWIHVEQISYFWVTKCIVRIRGCSRSEKVLTKSSFALSSSSFAWIFL